LLLIRRDYEQDHLLDGRESLLMMAVHEQFADDLSLYALDALDAEERLAIERHLEECSECRSELERLQGEVALLGLSATGPTPPSHCRERLIAAVAQEPREIKIRQFQARPLKRAPWLNVVGWVAAAAAIIMIAVLVRRNNDLQGQLAALQARSTSQEQQLLRANELLTLLNSPNAEHFTLAASNTAPRPQAKAIYDPRTGTLVLFASNMPPLPSHKAYELWLIPTSGAAPIPAGIFKPNIRGSATVIKPPLPSGSEPKTFAITVEPEAGSPAPTSQPIMVGTRG
jgi:anti-sigma-K factor RskA